MAGFVVKRLKNSNDESNDLLSVGDYFFEVKGSDYQKFTLSKNEFILLDGYFWGESQEKLIEIISSKNFSELSLFDGHFCGLYFNDNELVAFNDRFGGRTIFWQYVNQELTIASSPPLMPISDATLDLSAVHECFWFRWTTSDKTLLRETSKLRARSYGVFNNSKLVQKNYWFLPKADYNQKPFIEKKKQVKQALVHSLYKARQHHKKVAIFLSGGVDSSLLAGLCKDIFDECYLITPVFKGQDNPELETAISFAKHLNLPHHLVEVSPESIEENLNELIQLKREPLRHYSSLAIHTMLKNIPEEFSAVVYGEAADTLFGSNSINRISKHFRWKKSSHLIPDFLLKLFRGVVPGRGEILVKLKSTSLSELLHSLSAIQYNDKCKKVITKLNPGQGYQLEEKSWDRSLTKSMSINIRHVAQECIISLNIAKHFEETELIAKRYNKQIISPFFDTKAIEVANTLSEHDFFGDTYVKPILRELACDYFPKKEIYQKKHGFPVPFIAWLSGPISHLVEDIRNERELFDGNLLANLTVKEDYEVFWLLINWKIFNQKIEDKLTV